MQGLKTQIRQLMKLLRRHGRSREDAEDLIQEAFVRLHVYCQSGEVRERKAFLARTALNLSVDRHRREHRDLYVEQPVEELPLIDLRPTPDEEVAAQQRLDQVRRVLDSLSPRTREIFLRHRLDGYGCSQIAAEFGVSVSAVEKHIARAVLAIMEVVKKP